MLCVYLSLRFSNERLLEVALACESCESYEYIVHYHFRHRMVVVMKCGSFYWNGMLLDLENLGLVSKIVRASSSKAFNFVIKGNPPRF